jgi:hypothetical protein
VADEKPNMVVPPLFCPDMGSEGSWLYGTMIPLYKLARNPRIRDCVFERVWEIVPSKGLAICPNQDKDKHEQTKK